MRIFGATLPQKLRLRISNLCGLVLYTIVIYCQNCLDSHHYLLVDRSQRLMCYYLFGYQVEELVFLRELQRSQKMTLGST
jgi:hypothetical protein